MRDYWVVIDTKTGKTIANCGEEKDAMMMVSFNQNNRTYIRKQFLLDQVIDVSSTVDKQLPGQLGLPEVKEQLNASEYYSLPQNESNPVII